MYLQVIDFPPWKACPTYTKGWKGWMFDNLVVPCAPEDAGISWGQVSSQIPSPVDVVCMMLYKRVPRDPDTPSQNWKYCFAKASMVHLLQEIAYVWVRPHKNLSQFVEIMQNDQAAWNPWSSFSKVFERAQLHVQWGLFTILCPLDLLKLSRPPSPITTPRRTPPRARSAVAELRAPARGNPGFCEHPEAADQW